MRSLDVYPGQVWTVDLVEGDVNALESASLLDALHPSPKQPIIEHSSEHFFEAVVTGHAYVPRNTPPQESVSRQARFSLEAALDDQETTITAALGMHEYFEQREGAETVTISLRLPIKVQSQTIDAISASSAPSEERFLTSVAFMIGEGSRLLIAKAADEFTFGDAELHRQELSEMTQYVGSDWWPALRKS